MKSRDEIDAALRALLADLLETAHGLEGIPDDVPIFGGGLGLDSMSAVQFMTAIEKTFLLRIEDDEFDIFDSLTTLVTFVHERQGSAG